MSAPPTYKVRCALHIAEEMVRYEGSRIISKEAPQCREIWKGSDVEKFYTTYWFSIEGRPIVGRWRSFGVAVTIMA